MTEEAQRRLGFASLPGTLALATLIGMPIATPASAQPDFSQKAQSLSVLAERERASALVSMATTDPNSFVFAVQEQLSGEGLFAGQVDGFLNAETISAINNYCDQAGIAAACAKGPLSPEGSSALANAIFPSQNVSAVSPDLSDQVPAAGLAFSANLVGPPLGADIQAFPSGEAIATFSPAGRLYRVALSEVAAASYTVAFDVDGAGGLAGNMTVDIGDGPARTALHLEGLAGGTQRIEVTVEAGDDSQRWLDIHVSVQAVSEVTLSKLRVSPAT